MRKPAIISVLLCAVLFCGAQPAGATTFLSADADARLVMSDFSENAGQLKTIGLIGRHSFADRAADRVVLYGQVEFMDNLSDVDIHQLSVMYKGPMGRWNITAGRLRLPYGLLSGYSTDHVLFRALDPYTLGKESDDGLLVSGTIGSYTYGLAVTQGAGLLDGDPEAALVTGRADVTLGESGELIIGISAAAGKSESSHGGMTEINKISLGGIDLVANAGRLTLRAETTAGVRNDELHMSAFANADFALRSWLELNAAISAVREAGMFHHRWGFAGITVITRYITLKGGYKHAIEGPVSNEITISAYSQYAVAF
jgi:hypothetical protein